MEQQTGTEIALQAVKALHEDIFESRPGYCQKFARQVAEAVGGDVGEVMDKYRMPSAYETMRSFRNTPYAVEDHIGERHFYPSIADVEAGDFLYKGVVTSGTEGHVGIVVPGHMVGQPALAYVICENSSYHTGTGKYGTVDGAKGFRTLTMFGAVEMIVRLTEV